MNVHTTRCALAAREPRGVTSRKAPPLIIRWSERRVCESAPSLKGRGAIRSVYFLGLDGAGRRIVSITVVLGRCSAFFTGMNLPVPASRPIRTVLVAMAAPLCGLSGLEKSVESLGAGESKLSPRLHDDAPIAARSASVGIPTQVCRSAPGCMSEHGRGADGSWNEPSCPPCKECLT